MFACRISKTRADMPVVWCNINTSTLTLPKKFSRPAIQEKKVVVIINNRKMFCDNPKYERNTFAENFSFMGNKSKKTHRLENKILNVSNNMSSVAAQRLLRNGVAMVSKSTICLLFKKRNNHS